ncbi:MAG: DUF2970 domain-containing protein [Burkholderiaceae bacterium]|nr:DUF2970 domain-containing protein [Burkholderiaceae bacterium]
MTQDLKQAAQRPLSFWQTVKAVAWSFIGLRKGAGYQQDIQKLNPVHVIVTGIIGAVLFVLTLVLIVRWVVGSGVAG